MRLLLLLVALQLLIAAPDVSAVDVAIVLREATALRAEARDAARQHAALSQGDVLEVRGERLDHLNVYDHRRERGGFVRASHVRRLHLTADEAPELLALVRYLRDTPGSEGLGVALIAAYIQTAPAALLQSAAGAEALEALGTFAERLAQRASWRATQGKAADAALASQLDVAARYGIAFTSFEVAGRMRICYDGDAFRRVLTLPASARQRAHAVLALTRPDCIDPALTATERMSVDERRAELLDRVDVAALPAYLRNRVVMRRAGVWATVAYHRARKGDAAQAAASRALTELAAVVPGELTDDDKATYAEAAMRVNATRWAAAPDAPRPGIRGLAVMTSTGQPGETCIALVDDRHDAAHALVRRCTYGIVWPASVTVNREGTAVALAVQHLDTWRELWILRDTGRAWSVRVVLPAPVTPGVGYAEFAGWVPGGRQVLVAREARGDGVYQRAFEVMRLDTLRVERRAVDPGGLDAFRRWQDPAWRGQTVALR